MKRALVTGGTRGIGAATAQALLEAGYEVVVTGTAPNGQAPKGCAYRPCDFTDSSALQAFAKDVAALRLAILVNNAGVNKAALLAEYNPADFTRILQVNVTAPFLLCQAVVPGMQKRRFGRIVNVTSIFGVVSKAGRAAYSASKFGLFGLSRALALEVAVDNILVNCVAPGFVDTDMTRRILGVQGIAEVTSAIPIGRLARPEEVARYIQFLVSDENTYMTGQHLIVDGGFTCG